MGRPLKHGERTVPIRVPKRLAGEVEALIKNRGRKLPLYIMKPPVESEDESIEDEDVTETV